MFFTHNSMEVFTISICLLLIATLWI